MAGRGAPGAPLADTTVERRRAQMLARPCPWNQRTQNR